MNKQTVSPSGKNRGIVYIILMVLFTLVMIADLVILALVPATGTRNFPNFDPSSNPFFNGGGEAPGGQFPMPSGGDPGGFSPPGGQLPEGFTLPSGISPPTNEEFEMPEGFTLPEGGFNFPGGNTGGRPPSGGRPFGSGNSFLSFVRRAWLPILIVCLLGDGICLFLYIRLRRKKSAETQQSLAESEEGSEDDADDKKKKKGGWILPLCLVLAVAVVIASLPLGDSDTKAVSANEQVISDTAEKGTILTVLSGTGTLTDEAAELVSIPVSVGITAYHVNNGDTVAAGDVLASVDKASVGVAIAELQTVIDELDKDLDVASDESADAAITAAVGGRVKLIYAREDESVADTVSEHGCLMLLSLDGLMAVDLENADGISVGDTVKVAFSDGTEESGRAAAKEDGILTVTISDESASCGDVVSVWKEDEQQLGEGSLYIHSELRITGYYGNISSVPVEVNTLVDEGDTLLELSDVGRTSAYENLLNRRKQLEDQMASLFRLYRDGYIRAESSGIVSGISADSTVVSLSAKSNKKETNLAGSGVVKTSAVTQSRTVSLMRLTTLSYQKTSQVKMLSGLQQPVNPPQPTGSQKPSDPPAPTGSQEPSNPPQPTGSQKPSDPPAPTGSQEPSNPPQPTGSQESTGPTQPTGPQEPTGPTQPTGPQ
ncbi:MAG: hypothetical protein GX900_02370, partial [Clostridiaceae bacterium]|nr:hypothetical protein [Clostridiaceae bacterium]